MLVPNPLECLKTVSFRFGRLRRSAVLGLRNRSSLPRMRKIQRCRPELDPQSDGGQPRGPSATAPADPPCPKAERAPRPKAAAQAQQLRKSCRKRTNRDQLTVS